MYQIGGEMCPPYRTKMVMYPMSVRGVPTLHHVPIAGIVVMYLLFEGGIRMSQIITKTGLDVQRYNFATIFVPYYLGEPAACHRSKSSLPTANAEMKS